MLHPGCSAPQDDCDRLKEIQTSQSVFFSFSRMVMGAARLFSRTDTELRRWVWLWETILSLTGQEIHSLNLTVEKEAVEVYLPA